MGGLVWTITTSTLAKYLVSSLPVQRVKNPVDQHTQFGMITVLQPPFCKRQPAWVAAVTWPSLQQVNDHSVNNHSQKVLQKVSGPFINDHIVLKAAKEDASSHRQLISPMDMLLRAYWRLLSSRFVLVFPEIMQSCRELGNPIYERIGVERQRKSYYRGNKSELRNILCLHLHFFHQFGATSCRLTVTN